MCCVTLGMSLPLSGLRLLGILSRITILRGCTVGTVAPFGLSFLVPGMEGAAIFQIQLLGSYGQVVLEVLAYIRSRAQ